MPVVYMFRINEENETIGGSDCFGRMASVVGKMMRLWIAPSSPRPVGDGGDQ